MVFKKKHIIVFLSWMGLCLQWIALSQPYRCLTKFGDIYTKLYPVLGTSLVASLIFIFMVLTKNNMVIKKCLLGLLSFLSSINVKFDV